MHGKTRAGKEKCSNCKLNNFIGVDRYVCFKWYIICYAKMLGLEAHKPCLTFDDFCSDEWVQVFNFNGTCNVPNRESSYIIIEHNFKRKNNFSYFYGNSRGCLNYSNERATKAFCTLQSTSCQRSRAVIVLNLLSVSCTICHTPTTYYT